MENEYGIKEKAQDKLSYLRERKEDLQFMMSDEQGFWGDSNEISNIEYAIEILEELLG